jgi:hypothetical protein
MFYNIDIFLFKDFLKHVYPNYYPFPNKKIIFLIPDYLPVIDTDSILVNNNNNNNTNRGKVLGKENESSVPDQ